MSHLRDFWYDRGNISLCIYTWDPLRNVFFVFELSTHTKKTISNKKLKTFDLDFSYTSIEIYVRMKFTDSESNDAPNADMRCLHGDDSVSITRTLSTHFRHFSHSVN